MTGILHTFNTDFSRMRLVLCRYRNVISFMASLYESCVSTYAVYRTIIENLSHKRNRSWENVRLVGRMDVQDEEGKESRVMKMRVSKLCN